VTVKSIVQSPVGVFLLALALRLTHLFEIVDQPWFAMTLGDALAYDEWAREIAGGDGLGDRVFYQAPLYPYFLAAVYALAGHDLLVVRVVQALLGSAACALLVPTGTAFFSRRVGLLAGALLALAPLAVYFDGLLQKASLGLFLLASTLFLLSRVELHGRPRDWLFAGGALGLLILTRENSLVLLPVLLAWAVFRGRRGARPFAGVLALVAGAAAVLLPVASRNAAVGGELHLTTSQLGPNLYIGNNPWANGTYAPLRFGRGSAEFERDDAFALAAEALGREPTPREVSRYWIGEALGFVRDEPGRWLRLTGRKLLLAVNGTEHGDTEDVYTRADGSVLLRVLLACGHFGVLLPFAVLGIVATRGDVRRHGLLLALLAAYGLSVVAFFVLDRYRFPLVPFAALYAAAGLLAIRDRLRAGRLRELAVPAAAALAVAVLANLPLTSRDAIRAATLYNVGVELAREPDRLDDAIGYYERAVRRNPGFTEAHYNLGNAWRRRQRPDRAEAAYRRALELRPDFAAAWLNLGRVHVTRGALDDAAAAYRRAVELDPASWEARNNLGLLLARQGRVGEAVALLDGLAAERPADARLSFNRGNVLLAAGRLDEALASFTRARDLEPDNPRIHNNLGYALAAAGRLEEAAASYREALRLDPGYGAARTNLDAALAALEEAQGVATEPPVGRE
jgi:tetratricopeptide (TPR) repeat protein